jgi:hypothetical protein
MRLRTLEIVKLRLVRHPAPVADSTRFSGLWLAPIVGQPDECSHGLPVGIVYIECASPEAFVGEFIFIMYFTPLRNFTLQNELIDYC